MPYGAPVSTLGINKSSTGVGERIEPGIYEVIIKDIERIALKNGTAGYGAKFHFEILNEGPMKGREVGELLNVEAVSEKNRTISLERLAGLAIATGVPEHAVLNQQTVPIDNLMGRTLSVVLGPQRDDPRYVDVKAYMPVGASQNPENWEKMKYLFQEPAPSQQQAPATQGAWGNAPAQQAPAQQQPVAGGWGGQQPAQAPAQQQPAAGGWGNAPAQQAPAQDRKSVV